MNGRDTTIPSTKVNVLAIHVPYCLVLEKVSNVLALRRSCRYSSQPFNESLLLQSFKFQQMSNIIFHEHSLFDYFERLHIVCIHHGIRT